MGTPIESAGFQARHIAALCLLGLLVIVAPELLGGVYPWAMLAIAGTSLLALAPLCIGGARDGLPWSPLLSVLTIALVWTLLQLTPLPCGLTRVLAPDSARELARVHSLLGMSEPQFCPLSGDATATREEVVKSIAILATFWCAFTLARRGFRPVVHHAVAASAVLLAVAGALHAQFGATRVFGIYKPIHSPGVPFLAPIVSINSYGGALVLCLPLLMALALVERERMRKSALLVSSALVLFVIFMTRSRGAIGALAIALLSFSLFALRRWQGGGQRRLQLRQKVERFLVPLALVWMVGIALYAWGNETAQEFRSGGVDKLELIAAAARLALDHPIFGVGRGAFATTFAGLPGTNRFDHAENFIVHWAAEWGIPLTLLLVVTLTSTIYFALRRARSLDRIGALIGLIVFGLQNFVDLGFELIGVGVMAMALLGAAINDRQVRGDSVGSSADVLRARAAFGLIAVAGIMLALWAAPMMRDHRIYLERALGDRVGGGEPEAFARLARRAMLAHPSEPSFPLLAASDALARHDSSAGKWINRGMQLRPKWSGPHVQAAQWLWNTGRRDQARLELSIALDLDRHSGTPVLCPITNADPLAMAAALPRSRYRELLLNKLVECVGATSPAARRLDAISMAEFPRSAAAHLREGGRLLAEHDPSGALAQSELARAGEAEPRQQSNALRARALAEFGRTLEAIALLRETARVARDPGPLLGLEAEFQCALGDHKGMLDALDRMRGSAAGRANSVAEIFQLQGRLESRLGNLGAALQAFRQAYSIVNDTSSLEAIAVTALALGDRGRALWAYRELCDRAGSDRTACVKRDELLGASTNLELPTRAVQPIQR